MTIAIREYTDREGWDALVASHPHGHLLQNWAWGELKSQFGWMPVRLAIVTSSDTMPRAAAQMLVRRFMGLSVCYVPRGPMLSGEPVLDATLLTALRRMARRRRAAFLRLEPNILEDTGESRTLHSFLQTEGFRIAQPLQPRTSIHLSLEPSPEQLFGAFSKGHRADVRRAERNGVAVREGCTDADLNAFYVLMEETARRAEFAIHSREYYRAAWSAAGDDAQLLLAYDKDGLPLAGFLVFAFGHEGQYMYSASTTEGLKSGANHLLQWHTIRWMRERGCRTYDLWGVPEIVGGMVGVNDEERARIEEQAKGHPLYGAYRFKKGWGGEVVRYLPAYDAVFLAPAYWLWRRRNESQAE
jgi:serine/alanine adding enzyme